MKAEIRIKLKQWGKKIAIFMLAILVIFVVAKIIGAIVQFSYNPPDINRQNEIKNAYDTPIFGSRELEEDKKTECSDIIAQFVKYGNEKNYQQILNMLTEDYKSVAMKDVDAVKKYIDRYFDNQKGFSYQNMTNSNDVYIYELKIYDDLMISGTNSYTSGNQNKIYFVINSNNDELKVSLDGFISKSNIGLSAQNEYFKFTLLSKEIYYDKVKFNLQYENLTNNRVLAVYDGDVKYLVYNKDTEKIIEYTHSSTIISTRAMSIMPGSFKDITLTYNKYIGSAFTGDYRININTIYSYDLADYLEVMFENPNITEKAKETYSNVYISL